MKRKPSKTSSAVFQLFCKNQVRATKIATITSGCGVCNSHRMPSISPCMSCDSVWKKPRPLVLSQSNRIFAALPTGILLSVSQVMASVSQIIPCPPEIGHP